MIDRSSSTTDLPVVIVGAGPSGLLLAIELLRRDVPVRIFEKHKDLTQLTQATSIKPRSLDILDDLGLVEAFYERGVEIRKFRFLKDGTHFAEVDFGLIEGIHKCTLSLPETETVDILGEHIRTLGGTIEFGTICTDFLPCEDRVDVSIEMDEHQDVIAASWLVGADGYHSKVRDLIGASLEGTEYPETWAAVDARIEGWSIEDGRIDLCLGLPVVAPFPIGNDTWRLVFGPCEDTNDPISTIIGRLGETRPGAKPVFVTPVQYFHANAKIADKFQNGRVFLIGDAAHATNPMDGHGMNMGLQDAFNLGWKLALAWHGYASEELLSTYAVERREVNSIAVNTGVTTNSRLMDRTGKLLEAHFETLSDSEQKRVSAMGASEKVWSYGPNRRTPNCRIGCSKYRRAGLERQNGPIGGSTSTHGYDHPAFVGKQHQSEFGR